MEIVDHVDTLARELRACDGYDLARFAGWALYRAATYPAVMSDTTPATDLARLLWDGVTDLPDHIHLHASDDPDQQALAEEIEAAAQLAVTAFTDADPEAAAGVAEVIFNIILFATYPHEKTPVAEEMAAQHAMAHAILNAQPNLRVEGVGI